MNPIFSLHFSLILYLFLLLNCTYIPFYYFLLYHNTQNMAIHKSEYFYCCFTQSLYSQFP
nr:MAG TPA: hypothetical protein [Caudoviricetes sp.]